MKGASTLPIDGYKSMCNPHAQIIKSSDKGNPQSHIAKNEKGISYVTHYKIDGYVITEGSRCDFLLINEDRKTVYFIELKGSDLCKAAQQLEDTETALAQQLRPYPNRKYRIVANKCKTQEIYSSAFIRYKKKWKNALECKSMTIEESINRP